MPSQEYKDEKAKREKENQSSGKIIAATFLLCFISAAVYIVIYAK
jgi:hypothetical protein